jgi:hypothetical protein
LNTAAKQPSAVLPVAMSLAALATVFVHITLYGTEPQADEGAAAHVWQLLMAGQLPIMLFYAIKWIPRTPQIALAVLALQIAAAVSAAAPVFLLRW